MPLTTIKFIILVSEYNQGCTTSQGEKWTRALNHKYYCYLKGIWGSVIVTQCTMLVHIITLSTVYVTRNYGDNNKIGLVKPTSLE